MNKKMSSRRGYKRMDWNVGCGVVNRHSHHLSLPAKGGSSTYYSQGRHPVHNLSQIQVGATEGATAFPETDGLVKKIVCIEGMEREIYTVSQDMGFPSPTPMEQEMFDDRVTLEYGYGGAEFQNVYQGGFAEGIEESFDQNVYWPNQGTSFINPGHHLETFVDIYSNHPPMNLPWQQLHPMSPTQEMAPRPSHLSAPTRPQRNAFMACQVPPMSPARDAAPMSPTPEPLSPCHVTPVSMSLWEEYPKSPQVEQPGNPLFPAKKYQTSQMHSQRQAPVGRNGSAVPMNTGREYFVKSHSSRTTMAEYLRGDVPKSPGKGCSMEWGKNPVGLRQQNIVGSPQRQSHSEEGYPKNSPVEGYMDNPMSAPEYSEYIASPVDNRRLYNQTGRPLPLVPWQNRRHDTVMGSTYWAKEGTQQGDSPDCEVGKGYAGPHTKNQFPLKNVLGDGIPKAADYPNGNLTSCWLHAPIDVMKNEPLQNRHGWPLPAAAPLQIERQSSMGHVRSPGVVVELAPANGHMEHRKAEALGAGAKRAHIIPQANTQETELRTGIDQVQSNGHALQLVEVGSNQSQSTSRHSQVNWNRLPSGKMMHELPKGLTLETIHEAEDAQLQEDGNPNGQHCTLLERSPDYRETEKESRRENGADTCGLEESCFAEVVEAQAVSSADGSQSSRRGGLPAESQEKDSRHENGTDTRTLTQKHIGKKSRHNSPMEAAGLPANRAGNRCGADTRHSCYVEAVQLQEGRHANGSQPLHPATLHAQRQMKDSKHENGRETCALIQKRIDKKPRQSPLETQKACGDICTNNPPVKAASNGIEDGSQKAFVRTPTPSVYKRQHGVDGQQNPLEPQEECRSICNFPVKAARLTANGTGNRFPKTAAQMPNQPVYKRQHAVNGGAIPRETQQVCGGISTEDSPVQAASLSANGIGNGFQNTCVEMLEQPVFNQQHDVDGEGDHWLDLEYQGERKTTEEFKEKVRWARAQFNKLLCADPKMRHQYQTGEDGNFPCLVCGRRGYNNLTGLVNHCVRSTDAMHMVQHLGFHLALCDLMGWQSLANSDSLVIDGSPDHTPPLQHEPDLPTIDDAAAAAQTNGDKNEQILWPPMVIVENTRVKKTLDGKWEGINHSEMRQFLRDMGHSKGKPKALYYKEGHRGIVLVIYAPTLEGLHEAERLHKHFEMSNRDRKFWACLKPFWHGLPGHEGLTESPDLVRQDEETKLPKRVFYGYLGLAKDKKMLDPDIRKKLKIVHKSEMKARLQARQRGEVVVI